VCVCVWVWATFLWGRALMCATHTHHRLQTETKFHNVYEVNKSLHTKAYGV
jgi:hypothetical protein